MEIDLELYRSGVAVSTEPLVRLSAIDIAPEQPRRTLLFLHGFGGRARQWIYQLSAFSAQDRTIALDLRGHGLADTPGEDYRLETLLNDLDRAVEKLAIEGRIVLVGHSFGGALACEYARRRPERVSHLILIATSPEFRLRGFRRFALSLPDPVLRLGGRFTRNWLHGRPAALRIWHQQTMSVWDGRQVMPAISVPTLVLRGHRDQVFPKAEFEQVARLISGAEDQDVGASGHMVMLERRDAVNRAIERFVEVGPRSWRETGQQAKVDSQLSFLKERPWLSAYLPGTPQTIAVPRVPVQQLLRSAARRYPLRTALLFEGARLSYRVLNHEANRFANALRSLGLQKGDRVMLILPNIPQVVIAFFGTLKAGGVPVFAPVVAPAEIAAELMNAGARILVTLPAAAAGLPADPAIDQLILADPYEYLPSYKKVLLVSRRKADPPIRHDPKQGVFDFQKLIYSRSRQGPVDLSASEDMAVILYTGGTTATSKGVMLSHRNLVANTLQTRHWLPEARDGRERFLCVLPFSHGYGLMTGLILPVAIAATLVLKTEFHTRDILETIKAYRPTIFPGVPRMYQAINDFPGVRKYGVESIKACLSGSDPLPVETQERFEKLTRGRLVEGYGLAEASPVTHVNPLGGERRVGSIGVPIPSTEARILDLKRGERAMPPGQIGELAVRGPQVMLGYWNDPEATRQVLRPDGWLLTGDVAVMETDGFFRLVARKADLWYPEREDEPAFPRDVEEVLYEIPQVKEAAVIAVAGQPIAFLIARPDRPEISTVIAYCQRRLPRALVPRLVLFVEEFPRTFIGKILRRELAARVEEQLKSAN